MRQSVIEYDFSTPAGTSAVHLPIANGTVLQGLFIPALFTVVASQTDEFVYLDRWLINDNTPPQKLDHTRINTEWLPNYYRVVTDPKVITMIKLVGML